MAKAKERDIRWGDGYVCPRELKSGTTVYQARWKEPHTTRGTIWRSKNFGSQEAAYDHLREIGRKRRRGTYTPESEITVTEAVAEFAESRLALGRWTEGTYRVNTHFAKRLIDPHIGSRRVTRLTTPMLQAWADELGRDKSTSTIRSALTIVRGALRRQIHFGTILNNPADHIEVVSRPVEERQPWSVEDIQAILRHTETDLRMHTYYVLSFSTGMRPGELRALRWSDIDWDANVIRCERTITLDRHGREIMGTTTKTKKSRAIVIGMPVADALRKWRAAQNELRLQHPAWLDTIIIDRGDGHFMPSTTFAKRHHAIIAGAGVHKESPHNTRHTETTIEDAFGVSEGVRQARLGHASSNTTKRYTHAQLEAQKQVADLMAGVVTATTSQDDETG